MNKKNKKKSPLDYIKTPEINVEPAIKRGIFVIIIIALGAVSFLSLFDMAGILGQYLAHGLALTFGWGRWFFPISLFVFGFLLYNEERYFIKPSSYLGVFLFFASFQTFLHFLLEESAWHDAIALGGGGGYIGYLMAFGFMKISGFWASLIIIFSLLIISLMLIFNTNLQGVIGGNSPIGLIIKPFKFIFDKIMGDKNQEKDEDNDYENEEDLEAESNMEEEEEIEEYETNPKLTGALFKNKSVPLDDKNENQDNQEFEPTKTKLPKNPVIKIDLPLNLLSDKAEKPTSGDIKNHITVIQKTLENFGISVEMGDVLVGPTVTQYSLKPSEGVKLSRITALRDDLSLALAAHPIRIEAPIPGKSLVGIEVPNAKKAMVSLKEILTDTSFKERKNNMMLALGKDVSGKVWSDDLTKMPHLIVAGATNSGKSVCLNTIIVSLLYQNNPDCLKFIFVDPKRVELTVYNGIPHLIAPVITDVNKTINALRWCLNEMDRRFETLSQKGKRNIQAYNENLKPGEEKMPYLVFVVDELADLMVTAKRDVEAAIVRLAQMARAVGIHLILATQRPSTDVVTGLIKANMPARIAFAVASGIDSRTILDSQGAEDLLGQGDMLLSTPNLSQLKRLQGAYLSDLEIKRIVNHIKDQVNGETNYLEEITESQKVRGMAGMGMPGDNNGDSGDELLEEAKRIVVESNKASASLLQRRLSVGYARAARLLDLLEESGVVGPSNGAKPREIFVGREDFASQDIYPTSSIPIHEKNNRTAPEDYLNITPETPTIFKPSQIKKDELESQHELKVNIPNEQEVEKMEKEEEFFLETVRADNKNNIATVDKNEQSEKYNKQSGVATNSNWEEDGKFFSK